MNGAGIIALVAEAFAVPPTTLTGMSRSQGHVRPRHLAMALVRDYCGYSYPQIGRLFGDRDHTTVISGIRTAEKLVADDPDFAARADTLRDALDMVDFSGPVVDKASARAMAETVARAIRASLMRSATKDPAAFLDAARSLVISCRSKEIP